MNMDELKKLASRMVKALRNFECYVFEKEELKNVYEVVKASGIKSLVTIKKADPRYEYIYILVPWSRDFENECKAIVDKALSEGRISRESYKKEYATMIAQCVKHKERERIKDIIAKLEQYIKGNGDGGPSGKLIKIPFDYP